MKKWRRVVAAALAGVMVLGTTGMMSYADEVNSITNTENIDETRPTGTARTWEFVDGKWYLYNGDGYAYRNRIVKQGGMYYYLGDDYAMTSNEVIYLIAEKLGNKTDLQDLDLEGNTLDEIMKYSSQWYQIDKEDAEMLAAEDYIIMYSTSFGNLIQGKWRMVNEEGKASYDEDACDWYYFGDNGVAYRDGIHTVGDGEFCFYPDGVMVRRGWYAADVADALEAQKANTATDKQNELIGAVRDELELSPDEDNSKIDLYQFYNASKKSYYFQNEGFPATNMRYIEEDDTWYFFDDYGTDEYKSGKVTEERAKKWTRAQVNTLTDVFFVEEDNGSEYEIEVGDTLVLDFAVELASASNATHEELRKVRQMHDVYVTRTFDPDNNPGMMTKNTTVKTHDITKTGGKISYTANAPGTVTLTLNVDAMEAVVTVTSVLPEVISEDAAQDLITNALSNAGSGLETDCVGALIEVAQDEELLETMTGLWADNLADIENMETALVFSEGIEQKEAEISDEVDTDVIIMGALLLAEESTQVVVGAAEDTEAVEEILAYEEIEDVTALEVDLKIDGSKVSDLDLPVVIVISAPEGFEDGDAIYHVHNGKIIEVDYTYDESSNKITFATNKFSTFVFAQKSDSVNDDNVNNDNTDDDVNNDNSNDDVNNENVNNDSSNDDSNSDNKNTVADSAVTEAPKPVVTTDAVKGIVNSETGIVTGTGEGYSSWIAGTAADGTTSWQFEYADGTIAKGSIETREDGSTYEQPAWELINGKWFAFGADAFAKSSWIVDEQLGGWFYVDINFGMLTGWQQIGNVWYYLNPISNGRMGICMMNTWIDGWFVGPTGAWDGKAQVAVQ